jgi:hypothetical protein
MKEKNSSSNKNSMIDITIESLATIIISAEEDSYG